MTRSSLSGEFHAIRSEQGKGRPSGASRSVWHKTRLFGQSHWLNSIVGCQDLFELLEPHFKGGRSDLLVKVHRCKSLARQIKAGYTPEWPTSLTMDLPSRDVSDALIRCYLGTYESIYRVLHVPTFRTDYEALWTSNERPSEGFMVPLKLVLAIGSATYDENFSLRTSAIRWVYEAQTWLANPSMKSKLGIQYLQINILALLAREVTGIGEQFIWTTVGTLQRTAMYMGLHRDPTRLPKTTPFQAEMKRRLWNTILELSLRSSFMSGGPPSISLDDFDTAAPANFDDEQLNQDSPTPTPAEAFSDTSIAIALRHTFPLRLKMTKFLNDLRSSNTSEEALRLDAEYKEAYKVLRQTFQQYNPSTGPSPNDFQLQTIDLILSRHLLALHLPFSSADAQDKTYAYSRNTVLETASKLWSVTTTPSTTLSHLAITTSGYFRIAVQQSSLLLALDARARLKEEQSLGPVPLRRDLSALLEEAKAWHLRTIEAGEPSVRGYLLIYLFAAHIEGLARGLNGAEMGALLVKRAEEAMDVGISVLEGKLGVQGPSQGDDGGVGEMGDLGMDTKLFEGWDFLMADGGGFDLGDMNWSSSGIAM
ncbi:uncharacterized protein LTR77_003905 [Saxophila tyrrhenica]|uniref:Xylanolytic transcriptional activator regulatory domain-containing protein n=1 Tax=Saxophila tyrrhenica TaxID=1690608 RepID=A0AAV9PGI0_9PEZI|nr:hypothetical protein LTR77_003905 [Saxophila tyrrhenica]